MSQRAKVSKTIIKNILLHFTLIQSTVRIVADSRSHLEKQLINNLTINEAEGSKVWNSIQVEIVKYISLIYILINLVNTQNFLGM